MMRKYKLMKLLPSLIMAAICLLIGGLLAFISQTTSAESLRAQGLVYPKVSKVSRLTAVPVQKFTYVSSVSNVVKEGKTVVYRDDKTGMSLFLVGDGLGDIPILMPDDSPLLLRLKEESDKGKLETEPYYVMAMVDDSDRSREFIKSIEYFVKSKTGRQVFVAEMLVNQSKADTYIQSMKLASYVFLTLSLLAFGFTVYRYSAMRRFWSQVYQAIPELARDSDLLLAMSQFKTKELGLYVYQDYLIVLGRRDQVLNLKDLLGLSISSQVINKRLNSKLVCYYQDDHYDLVKLRPYPDLDARALLEAFLTYISSHYPHILIDDERLGI